MWFGSIFLTHGFLGQNSFLSSLDVGFFLFFFSPKFFEENLGLSLWCILFMIYLCLSLQCLELEYNYVYLTCALWFTEFPSRAIMSDEGERTCPLCAEEMDLTDQQLKPCKCGYEVWFYLYRCYCSGIICRFLYNLLRKRTVFFIFFKVT